MEERLTIALPKGKLGYEAVELLRQAGLRCQAVETESRKLLFEDPQDQVRYIICRPTDIPTYVEYGAADLGIVGKDTIVEQNKEVFELVDLKFGLCKFVVAVPEASWSNQGLEQFNHQRVATKFPRIAENYFRSRGMQVEVIKLHGNIELAPIVGLAEMIVDLVSTGRTLKENKLIPVGEILQATARLIANRVSHRLKNKRINQLMEDLKRIVGNGNGGGTRA